MHGNNMDRVWTLLVRHVTGESAPRDDEEVHALIAMDESKADLFDEIQQVWSLAEPEGRPSRSESAWDSFCEHSQRDARRVRHAKPAGAHVQSGGPSRRKRRTSYFALAAAAAVAAIVAVAVVKLNLVTNPESPSASAEPRHFVTQRGQRASIQLTDGTEVRLNVDSRLTVLPDFDAGVRNVFLEGEAYLEVSADSTRPFVLHANGTSVRVLGTEFGVRAYPDEGNVRVVVAEGRIEMRKPQAASRDTVVLQARDMAIVTDEGRQIIRRRLDLSRYLSWTTGQLVFTDAEFREVATELERWYDLKIEAAMPVDDVVGLNASFSDESISEILNTIAATLNLSYTRNRRHITFHPMTTREP